MRKQNRDKKNKQFKYIRDGWYAEMWRRQELEEKVGE